MSEPGLVGQATAEGTRRGAESFGAGARSLGRTGYTVSPIGFGGYRVRDDSPLHRRALADALRGGVNLIDTSTNYGDGRSEKLVGLVLANLVQHGEVRREQVVVVSKVGYLQGDNLARAQARPQPWPQTVQRSDSLSHCIHPEFIAAQLGESLDRLGLQKLDVLLLHNPEYFLEEAVAQGRALADARVEYRQRLQAAFGQLEREVEAGRIGWYGVSSNGFVLPDTAERFTSMSDVLDAAREAGGDDHHLGVVQLPMNLLELGAVTGGGHGEGNGRSALDVAGQADLGVLVNRPLNAWGQIDGEPRLVRLADQSSPADAPRSALDDALARARKLEARWATGLGKKLQTEGGETAVDLFRWGQELGKALPKIGTLEQWMRMRYEVIAPHLGRTSAELLSLLEGEVRQEFSQWWESYGTTLHQLFSAVEHHLGQRDQQLAETIAQRLDPHLPPPWRELPLSRKAVLTLLCAPVGCVLVGMRQPGYVFDLLALREHPVRLLSAATGAADLRAIAAGFASMQAPA